MDETTGREEAFGEWGMELLEAVRCDQLSEVKRIIGSVSREIAKKLINNLVGDVSPAIAACQANSLEVVEYFLENELVDANQTTEVYFEAKRYWQRAALVWWTTCCKMDDMVRLLLKYGGDSDCRAEDSSSALHVASLNNDVGLAEILVEYGCSLNVFDDRKRTPLMVACEMGNFHMVEWFCERRVDVNVTDKCCKSGLHLAAAKGHERIVELLLMKGAEWKSDMFQLMPIHYAAMNGHDCVVSFLIDRVEVTWRHRIEALELLGAFYIQFDIGVKRGKEIWKHSLVEYETACVGKGDRLSVLSELLEMKEFNSVEDLEWLSDREAKAQAAHIYNRILSPAHAICMNCASSVAKLYLGYIPPLNVMKIHEYVLIHLPYMQDGSDMLLRKIVDNMMHAAMMWVSEKWSDEFPFGEILNVTDVLCKLWRRRAEWIWSRNHAQLGENGEEVFVKHTEIFEWIINLLVVTFMVLPPKDEDVNERFNTVVRSVISAGVCGKDGFGLLQTVVGVYGRKVLQGVSEKADLIGLSRRLIQVGSDPYELTAKSESLLHLAAVHHRKGHKGIIKYLMSLGIHFDQCNEEGETFLELYCASRGLKNPIALPCNDVGKIVNTDKIMIRGWSKNDKMLKQLYPMRLISLKCLAARAVAGQLCTLSIGNSVPEEVKECISFHGKPEYGLDWFGYVNF